MASPPDPSGEGVRDDLHLLADDPAVHALRLVGAASVLPHLSPEGLIRLIDVAREQGRRDAEARENARRR